MSSLVKKRESEVSGRGDVRLHVMVKSCPMKTYGLSGSTTVKQNIGVLIKLLILSLTCENGIISEYCIIASEQYAKLLTIPFIEIHSRRPFLICINSYTNIAPHSVFEANMYCNKPLHIKLYHDHITMIIPDSITTSFTKCPWSSIIILSDTILNRT